MTTLLRLQTYPTKLLRSRFILLLLLCIWCSPLLWAEGTKQLAPTPSDVVMLMTNRMEYGNFGAYGAQPSNRLYFSIEDANEIVYLGLSREYSGSGTPQFFGNYEFRIVRASDQTVVHGPIQVGLTNENISSWSDAVLGPYELTGQGYQTNNNFTFEPETAGDYYIEFKDVYYIGFWDITVAKNGTAQNGRVWSKNWSFRTPPKLAGSMPECLWDREFNGQLYSYTEDGFVTKIDFADSGFQGLSFNVAFNETGPGATGDLALDRMSVADQETTLDLGQHKIFLNEPDINLFPSGICGSITSGSFFECDDAGVYCLPVTSTQPGLVEIILDFNQNGMLDPGSEDVVLIHEFTAEELTACVPWDGLKGDSTVVGFAEQVNLIVRFAQGVQHWSVFDGEFLKNGFCVESIRPVCGDNTETNSLYWDDRNIQEVSGTGQPKDGRTGCDCATDDCRTWNNFSLNVDNCSEVQDSLTTGYGDRNILNTWWFANVISYQQVNVPLLSVQLDGPTSLCSGSSATLTANVSSAEAVATISWWLDGVFLTENTGDNAELQITQPGIYEAQIITITGCQTASSIEVLPETCPIDLELNKTVSNIQPYRTDFVQFAITVRNNGPGAASGIQIVDDLGSGLINVQNISLGGIASGNQISWNNLQLDLDEEIILTYEAQVAFSGSYTNSAQVFAANEEDTDSTPGNGINAEDDSDMIELDVLDCELDVQIININCNDNNTPTEPNDDLFTFEVLATGVGIGNTWTLNGDISGQGTYGTASTFGPFPISGGNIHFDFSDNEVADCTTSIEVLPPASCSDQCLLDANISNLLCDDNGTPSDASDDRFTFTLSVNSLNNTSNTWQTNIGVSGTYNQTKNFGPFLIADGSFNLQVFDSEDGSCQKTIEVTPPATCSDLCALSANVTSIYCDPNGTPSDASDDVYMAEVIVDGFNLGNNWVTQDGAFSGSYQETITVGPFDIATGSTTLVITDADDADCAVELTLDPPATCSDQCAMETMVQNVWCDDNGTPADASDDRFYFEAEVSGFNLGAGWLSQNSDDFGSYNNLSIFGPFAISDGAVSFNLIDAADQNCTSTFTVEPPTTCSDDCAIEATVSNINCNDNGTPSDASDDTFTFEVWVEGFNLSNNWNSLSGNESGSYNQLVQMGPYPIADGPITYEFADANDPNCSTTIEVMPPVTCSDVCALSANVQNILCDDNGTPSDASDDQFTFEIMVEGFNLSESWSTEDQTISGAFNQWTTMGPFPIAVGDQTITVVDTDDPNCATSIVIPAPATCSELCEINATVVETFCQDNDTPWDASDDVFFINMLVEGFNLGNNWLTNEGNTGAYNEVVTLGPYEISGGEFELVLTDENDPACMTTINVVPTAPCSDQCQIELASVETVCDANGTLFDATDDGFFVDVQFNGYNLSESWIMANGTSGNYGEVVRLGPFADFNTVLELEIMDEADTQCVYHLSVNPPAPCYLECTTKASLIDVYCDENGTPENGLDDQFYAQIVVTNLPIDTVWQASNGQQGMMDSIVTIGPFPAVAGDVVLDIADIQALDECIVSIAISAPTTTVVCPPDTSQLATERQMQLLHGHLDKSDEIYPEIDTFCWITQQIPDGIHYYDTIRLETGPEIEEGELFTFVLFTDYDLADTSSLLPEGMVDGLGAIFRGSYDELNPCCNLISGMEVPYQPLAAINWNPDWYVEVPQLDTLTAVLQFSVRLSPNEAYTLLTSSWTNGLEGDYSWLVFSNSSDNQVQFVHHEVDTQSEVVDGQLLEDLLPSDAVYFENILESTDYSGQAMVEDSCSFVGMTFSDSLVTNVCEDDVLYRTFIASNASGQMDSCTQQIIFNLPDFQEVLFPDWRVMFECGDVYPEDEFGNPHPSVTGYPYVKTAFDLFELDSNYYNLSAVYVDSLETLCGTASEIYRKWIVYDECVPDDSLVFRQLIKLGIDNPVIECPVSNHYCPILEENIMLFGTDPFEVTADVEIPLPEVSGTCVSGWFGQIEVLRMEGDTLISVYTILPGENRVVEDLAIGDYTIRYTVMDDCNTYGQLDCIIRVADLQEPFAICQGNLNFSIGNYGVRRIYTTQINNNSYDNAAIESIQIRRKYSLDPETCDELSAETYSDWGPWVEVTCCDVGRYVTVELQIIDIYGNTNMCWTEVLIEDKTAPTCYDIEDVNVNCAALPLDFDPTNMDQLFDLFGTVEVYDNCSAGIVSLQPVVDLDDCGNGTIVRQFYAQDYDGNISNTVSQTITIGGENAYSVRFPADTLVSCLATAEIDTAEVYRSGCDLVAVSHEDEIIENSALGCFEVHRTYQVINWCEYNGTDQAVIISRDEDCDAELGEEAVWLIRAQDSIYIDRDSLPFNNWPAAGTKGLDCDQETNPEGYWRTVANVAYWQYTQRIIVQDTLAPIIDVNAPEAQICTDDESCEATIVLNMLIDSRCDLDDLFALSIEWDEGADGTIDGNLTQMGLVSGTYPSFEMVGSFGIGLHRFVIFATDVCGNITSYEWATEVVACYGIAEGCTNAPSNYEIKFPKDQSFECELGMITDSVEINSLACDLLAVSMEEELVTSTDSLVCMQIKRTYQVINWCEYDGISDPVMISRDEDCDGEAGEENVWVLRRPSNIYIDRDSLHTNMIPVAGEKSLACDGNSNPNGFWRSVNSNGYWQYEQLITVFSESLPEIQLGADETTFFADSDDCEANMSMSFQVDGGCDGEEVQLNVYIDEFQDGIQELNSETENMLSGSFPNYAISAMLPIGTHDLIIELMDQCGHQFTEIIELEVVDGFVEAPTCVDTLLFELQEVAQPVDLDGDGLVDSGVLELEVADLINENATDCSGALNYGFRLLENPTDTLFNTILFTCNDLASSHEIEVYAWDQANNPYAVQLDGTIGGPNYAVCQTVIEIINPGSACDPANEETNGEELPGDLGIGFDAGGDGFSLAKANTTAHQNELFQNQPNPFSGSTRIAFYLAQATQAEILVTDLSGKVVKQIRGSYEKGTHEVTLEASELGGSGLYYYTLRTPTFVQSRKLIITQ